METEESQDSGSELNEALNAQEREKRRLSNKPYIDHLVDAVVEKDGKLHFVQEKNMRVIIERVASVLSNKPWLDTKSYIVVSVNQETGDLKLMDEELNHSASSNFITGTKAGYRFKVPAPKGSPLPKRNKAAPKAPVEVEKKKEKSSETERRIYSTRGVIHTRIKGTAYVPQGESKATDGMRLMTSIVGEKLKVRSTDGWEETWVADKTL